MAIKLFTFNIWGKILSLLIGSVTILIENVSFTTPTQFKPLTSDRVVPSWISQTMGKLRPVAGIWWACKRALYCHDSTYSKLVELLNSYRIGSWRWLSLINIVLHTKGAAVQLVMWFHTIAHRFDSL